jgi:hypothetical protein
MMGRQESEAKSQKHRSPAENAFRHGDLHILLHASSDLLPTVHILEQLTSCLCDLHCVTTRTCVKRVVSMHVVVS